MDFRTGAAGTRVAHFPKVVVLVAVDDVVLREILSPIVGSLVVAAQSVVGRTLEHGDVEVSRVDFEDIDKVIVCPLYLFFLKEVAKAPIAEHLEHRVVVGVMPDLLQVVMLAAHAETLLGVGLPAALRLTIAEDDVLKLVHAGVREHKGRIVLDYHRSRRHYEMPL